MITLLNIILGILLILAGAYLPFAVYKTFKEKIRYRLTMVSVALEFGLIAIAIGLHLLIVY